MKALVVGVGSIGTRHVANLSALGHTVYATDTDAARLQSISSQASEVFATLDEALAARPDAAFICTYSNDHVGPAVQCARAGCHVFIEKPLSTSLAGLDELIAAVAQSGRISMVACNMRFHPAIRAVHELLCEDAHFSRRLWAGLEFGYFLPFAKKDYESSYLANRKLGGNLIFDDIHELDYAVWFFGEPAEVLCTRGIVSGLKIDTEDHVDMIVRFASGVVCTIHMDYLQHGYCRRCKVVCEAGTVVWDFAQGRLGTITTDAPQWSWRDMALDIYHNEMYVDEVKYFLDCVERSEETFNSVAQSLPVLKLALAADRSCRSRAWESV